MADVPRMGLPPGKLCGGVLRNYDLLRPCLWSYCINPYTSSLNLASSKLAELVPGNWAGTCEDQAAAASFSPRRVHEADLWLVSCLCFVRRGKEEALPSCLGFHQSQNGLSLALGAKMATAHTLPSK